MTNIRAVALAVAAVTLFVAGSAHATGSDENAPAPISEGDWLGEIRTDCSDEIGTTRDYSCTFEGEAPAEFPVGSHCTETPAGVAISFECHVSLTAETVGKLGTTAGCINTPRPNELATTNGTVTVFSTVLQQAYSVPVKVWVTRGVGSFSGIGNFQFTRMKVTGTFSTTCGTLVSQGTFKGEFTQATVHRL